MDSRHKVDFKDILRQKLVKMMQDMVATGETRLPSENVLANQFQVSRVTIRAILAELEYDGKIFRRHGAGTFINKYALEQMSSMTPGRQFRKIILEQGFELDVQLEKAARSKANKEVARELKLRPKDDIVVTIKRFMANGKLAVYCINYMPGSQIRDSDYTLLTSEKYSIYQILDMLAERCGGVLASDKTTLGAACSGTYDFLSDDQEHHAYLLLNTTFYTQNEDPILYSKSYVNTEIIQYTLFCMQVREGKHQK